MKTLIIRMEIRDTDTWTQEKSVQVAVTENMLEAARNPFDIVKHEAGLMFQALSWFGLK